MRLACGIRNLISLRVIERDSKYYYWIVGLFSSVAILLEDKRRRPELAMYVLPRGLTALHTVLYDRNRMISIPNFEVFMFSTGMALLISHLQTEPETLSGVLGGLLKRIEKHIEDSS